MYYKIHILIPVCLQAFQSELNVRFLCKYKLFRSKYTYLFQNIYFLTDTFRIIWKRIIDALHIFETSCELWKSMLLQYILPNNEFQLCKMMDDNVLRWNLEIFHTQKFSFRGFSIINRKIEYCLLSRNELARFKFFP